MQAFINAHPDQFNSTGAKDISGTLEGDANNNGNLDPNDLAQIYVIIWALIYAHVLALTICFCFLIEEEA